jgi:hypothetical protein
MENKKQQAIRKAYGCSYEVVKSFIDEDGWYKWTEECPVNLVISGFDYNKNTDAHRPKDLQGIENNNGWISIDFGSDIPTDSYNYWIMQSDGIITTLKEHEGNMKYWDIQATHYKPIIKPLPPVY